MLRPPAHARALCLARTCLRWEECVVWEEGGWGPRGKRCGVFLWDRFLWENFPEIKVFMLNKFKQAYPQAGAYAKYHDGKRAWDALEEVFYVNRFYPKTPLS